VKTAVILFSHRASAIWSVPSNTPRWQRQ